MKVQCSEIWGMVKIEKWQNYPSLFKVTQFGTQQEKLRLYAIAGQ